MLGSLALLALLATPAPLATAARTPRPAYALSVLPTLQCPRHFACRNGTFDLSDASGINDKGWILGDSNVPGSTSIANATQHATLWRHGHITDLGTLGGPNSFPGYLAAKPSAAGLLVGTAQLKTVDPLGEDWGGGTCDAASDLCAGSQYENRGFVSRAGRMRPLPTLGGDNAQAWGGANARGEITGTAETSVKDPTCTAPQVLDWKPVIWGPKYGHIRQLPVYPGDTVGAALASNDKGQVVGGSGSCGPITFTVSAHALLWQPDGSMVNLGTLGGREDNIPWAINNHGQIVGWSDLRGDTTTRAFLWQHGHMTDLGTLPGDSSSYANDINNRGQVVGQSCDQQGNCRAFLWQHGVMTDLNQITHKPASFDLINAQGINDHGVIVGGVYDPGRATQFSYVVTPCANPPAANQHCAHSAPLTTQNAAAKITLPAAIRAQLRIHRGFGLLGGR